MNKFWEWMVEKEYAWYDKDEKEYSVRECNREYPVDFEKQMLIGYMIEYLVYRSVDITTTNFESDTLHSDLELMIEDLNNVT